MDTNRFICYNYPDMEKMRLKIKKTKRARKHGFLARMDSHGGRKVLSKRRKQGRKELTV